MNDNMSQMSSLSPSPSKQLGQASATRRPPRKSTLTQQQKNQKRQRATQEQLVTLEAEFNKNPTPTAVVRERIAQEINMTERSVQIWFQNRRAKIKHLAKKSIETGEDCDQIPECMRQYLAIQAMESGKGFARGYMGDRSQMSAYGSGGMMLTPEPSPQGKIVIHHFTCRSLSIGSWRRVGQNAMDLVIFYSPEKACLTYYINNDQAGYKIEFPFAYIKSIELDQLDVPPSVSNGGQKQGQLVITLTRPPNFYMDSSGQGGFYQCGDFTEDQQASQVLVHHLGGHPSKLSMQLAKLVTLEAYVNRHAHAAAQGMLDQPNFSISAPVSPHIVRPASSNDVPNHPSYSQEHALGHNMQQRHKRTRSRSVPIAVDFSQMQGMPSFAFPDHHEHLYAPAPQYTHALVNPGQHNPLRIDTSAPGFLDYRPGSTGYPLSATTTASPSDYASPSMINSSIQPEMNGAGYGTPYSLPFLSPMVDPASVVGPSVSPISMGADPVIASGSPPLHHIDRSASAELYHGYDQSAGFSEEISELYSKQSLQMPVEEQDSMDMRQMIHFPMQQEMSPEAGGM